MLVDTIVFVEAGIEVNKGTVVPFVEAGAADDAVPDVAVGEDDPPPAVAEAQAAWAALRTLKGSLQAAITQEEAAPWIFCWFAG